MFDTDAKEARITLYCVVVDEDKVIIEKEEDDEISVECVEDGYSTAVYLTKQQAQDLAFFLIRITEED